MKKLFSILLICTLAFSSVFASAAFEAGLGSGYVFYGDKGLRDLLSELDDNSQVIACGDISFCVPLASPVNLVFGADSVVDARWKGGQHINLWDYCGFAGFEVYPGLAGLCTAVEYCFGRRTDFISLDNVDSTVRSTDWGNGFAFSLGYDFGYGRQGFAPKLCAFFRHMPRGGSSDNIIEIKFKLKKS